MADYRYAGTIDIEEVTVIPAMGHNKFENNKVNIMLSSDDLSASVTWTLQISNNAEAETPIWADAYSGTDLITGTIEADTPVARVIEGMKGLFYRVSLTVAAQTGNITYSIKNENR